MPHFPAGRRWTRAGPVSSPVRPRRVTAARRVKAGIKRGPPHRLAPAPSPAVLLPPLQTRPRLQLSHLISLDSEHTPELIWRTELSVPAAWRSAASPPASGAGSAGPQHESGVPARKRPAWPIALLKDQKQRAVRPPLASRARLNKQVFH